MLVSDRLVFAPTRKIYIHIINKYILYKRNEWGLRTQKKEKRRATTTRRKKLTLIIIKYICTGDAQNERDRERERGIAKKELFQTRAPCHKFNIINSVTVLRFQSKSEMSAAHFFLFASIFVRSEKHIKTGSRLHSAQTFSKQTRTKKSLLLRLSICVNDCSLHCV